MGVAAVHGDRPAPPDSQLAIAGCLQPSVGFRDAEGAIQRAPVFLSGPSGIILPAFSPFAAGHDLSRRVPAMWRTFLGADQVMCFAASGSTVVPLGTMVLPFTLVEPTPLT
jgi:metallophosphoesterase superfamily enzyme